MGHDENRPTDYSSVPRHLTAPYVIPPLEYDAQGRPRSAVSPTVSAAPSSAAPAAPPSPRRARPRAVATVIFLAILLVVVGAVVAGLASVLGGSESGQEGARPADTSPGPLATDAPPDVVDSEYPPLDAAQLAALLQDPAAHAGEPHTAYAEIQVGTEAIPQSMRDTVGLIGFLGAAQPTASLQDAALTADPAILDGIVSGDVIRIRFRIPAASDRSTVYNGAGIPELRVASAEKVGSFR
jgi:hypothetical protein